MAQEILATPDLSAAGTLSGLHTSGKMGLRAGFIKAVTLPGRPTDVANAPTSWHKSLQDKCGAECEAAKGNIHGSKIVKLKTSQLILVTSWRFP